MRTKKATQIRYQITFELRDMKELNASYPNFRYNYNSFEEWVESNIEYLKNSLSDIGGFDLEVKRL